MRPIDADELISAIKKRYCRECNHKQDCMNCEIKYYFGDAIQNTKTLDVQPVVHGHWKRENDGDGYEYTRCSECGKGLRCYDVIRGEIKSILKLDMSKMKYCPHCGANMDEVSE